MTRSNTMASRALSLAMLAMGVSSAAVSSNSSATATSTAPIMYSAVPVADNSTTRFLNASFITQTPANGTHDFNITCLEPTAGTTLWTTNVQDCLPLLKDMLNEATNYDTDLWSSDSRNGSLIPHSWIFYQNSCEVQIQREGNATTAVDTFTTADVILCAAEVSGACLLGQGNSPILGGTALIRNQGDVRLVVRGRPLPNLENTPMNITSASQGNVTEFTA